MMKPIPVSMEEIVKSVPWDSLKDFSPDVVIGIERGGVFLAGLIARELGAGLCTIRASFYDDSKPAKEKFEKPKITLAPLPLLNGKRVLIVDDVSNTGKTLSAVRAQILSAGAAEIKTFVYAGKADFSCRPFEKCLIFPW